MAKLHSETNIASILNEAFQYLFEPDLIAEMCKIGQLRDYKADIEIMSPGEAITHIPLVLKGSIKVLQANSEGQELLLYYLEFSDMCSVSMHCMTGRHTSPIKAVTESPTRILFIPINNMETWMGKFLSWRRFVIESYNSRLNELFQAIDTLVFHDLESRLHSYLKDKALVTKSLELDLSHQKIASELNSSRVVISRLMKKLESENHLKQHRNRVVLLWDFKG